MHRLARSWFAAVLPALALACGDGAPTLPSLIVDVRDGDAVVVDVDVSVEGEGGVVDCDAELMRYVCAAPRGPAAIVVRRDDVVIGVVDTVVGDGVDTATVDLAGGA